MSSRLPGPLPENHTEYAIVPGDTMWQIARTAGLTLDQLTASNSHLERDPSHPGGDPWHWIYPGEIVHIPAAGATGQDAVEPIEDSRTLTVSIGRSEARALDLAAHVTRNPVESLVRQAILGYLDSLRADPEFRKAVAELIEADRKILERLRADA